MSTNREGETAVTIPLQYNDAVSDGLILNTVYGSDTDVTCDSLSDSDVSFVMCASYFQDIDSTSVMYYIEIFMSFYTFITFYIYVLRMNLLCLNIFDNFPHIILYSVS